MKRKELYIFIIVILIITGCGVGKDMHELLENDEDSIENPEQHPPRRFFGKLIEDKVRVRTLPSLNSEIIDQLALGEEVQVLCRTGIAYAISGMEDYWYVIKRKNGLVGWTYGYYIKFDEPAENAIYVHSIDYENEVKYEDRKWIGEYTAYRLLNKNKLSHQFAAKLQKSEIRISLDEAYNLYMGYHPDIDETRFVFIKSMKQMEDFTPDEYGSGKIKVSFINNYVVVTGEIMKNNQPYTYEMYYKKKTD